MFGPISTPLLWACVLGFALHYLKAIAVAKFRAILADAAEFRRQFSLPGLAYVLLLPLSTLVGVLYHGTTLATDELALPLLRLCASQNWLTMMAFLACTAGLCMLGVQWAQVLGAVRLAGARSVGLAGALLDLLKSQPLWLRGMLCGTVFLGRWAIVTPGSGRRSGDGSADKAGEQTGRLASLVDAVACSAALLTLLAPLVVALPVGYWAVPAALVAVLYVLGSLPSLGPGSCDKTAAPTRGTWDKLRDALVKYWWFYTLHSWCAVLVVSRTPLLLDLLRVAALIFVLAVLARTVLMLLPGAIDVRGRLSAAVRGVSNRVAHYTPRPLAAFARGTRAGLMRLDDYLTDTLRSSFNAIVTLWIVIFFLVLASVLAVAVVAQTSSELEHVGHWRSYAAELQAKMPRDSALGTLVGQVAHLAGATPLPSPSPAEPGDSAQAAAAASADTLVERAALLLEENSHAVSRLLNESCYKFFQRNCTEMAVLARSIWSSGPDSAANSTDDSLTAQCAHLWAAILSLDMSAISKHGWAVVEWVQSSHVNLADVQQAAVKLASQLSNVLVLVLGWTVDYALSCVLFLTALGYFLASESNTPLDLAMGILPPGKARNKLKHNISESLLQVMRATILLGWYHFLLVWVSFATVDLNFVVIPAVLTSVLAVIPRFPSFLLVVPFAAYTWLVKGSPYGALFVVLLPSLVAWWTVDIQIQAGVQDLHPFVTGLAVIMGFQHMGLIGVVLGPMLACFVAIAAKYVSGVYEDMAATTTGSSDADEPVGAADAAGVAAGGRV